MTLVEHLRELRNRLLRASIGVLVGFGVGVWLADEALHILRRPYCGLFDGSCPFVQLGPADVFLLTIKVALWLGLILSSPIWLYQLWAFIAPGLHRHERKWAYWFSAIAAPLFMLGAALAYFTVDKGLRFLLQFGGGGDVLNQLEITRYISFVTNFLLVFGIGFEFPLVILMLNFAGIASARKLLSWWRITVFLFFAFAAVVTPTPDPFIMSGFALSLSALYFAAIGVAFLNDRSRAKRAAAATGNLSDDEASPMEEEPASVEPTKPLDERYDDST